MNNLKRKDIALTSVLKFIIPSFIGVLLLMTPFKQNGSTTVAVSVLSTLINNYINKMIPIHYIVLILMVISCILPLIYKIWKPEFMEKNDLLKEIGEINYFWLFLRFLGLIFCIMVISKSGSEIIWSASTGGLVLFELINSLFTIFLVAGFILPFLTNFGLLEFIGVYLTKFMRPVFNLPGRSAVDCIASWIGDGTIGVALTSKQYTEGHYTEKEAAVIATSFSAVSITFCLVVLQNVNLTDYFGQYYLTICAVGIICALILPKIPPLSLKKNTYLIDNSEYTNELIPEGYTKNRWALTLAAGKAEESFSLVKLLKSSLETVLSMWISVIPIIMAVGTVALILSENTSIFKWLGLPFLPILNLFQVKDALAISETLVVGFADMVVPSILASSINSEMTRFIIATTSVCQLIYMSETGSVILGSKIPVNLIELFIIFLERTLISLPIIILMAHLFF